MYDIRDILNKAIAITLKRKEVYGKVLENTPDPRLRIMIQIMISRLDQDVNYYENIIKELNLGEIEPIDFGIYDTIASLINQFVRTLTVPKCKNKKEFLNYVIQGESAVLALAMDIQGRLTQAEGRTDSQAYLILSKAILHKRFKIQELEYYKE